MITLIDSKDSTKRKLYNNFFANMSLLLRTHDKNQKEVTLGSEQALLTGGFEVIENFSENDYQPGFYYVRYEDGYKLAVEPYDKDEVYYSAPTNDITSLDELFEHIADIALLNPNYTRLPLDEPLFEIDLNSRTIKVPTEFQKNGVGIQGDHIAESIFFSCPRFFDATDLGNDAYKIYIQWENAAGEQGVSIPTIKDIESKPGYIIFDLPICDKLTSKVGNSKIAIRFYRIDIENNAVLYSLSTQPAAISIKAGLNFNNFEKYVLDPNNSNICDHSKLILNRFINSEPLDIEVDVEEPVFIKDLPQYFKLDEDEEKNIFDVSATGDGVISYRWRRRYLDPRGKEVDEESNTIKNPHGYTLAEMRELYPLGDNPIENDYGRKEDEKGGDIDFSFHGSLEWIPTSDSVYVNNKDYYVENDRGILLYIEDKNQFDEMIANGKEVLEKKNSAKISKVGEYYVEATNTKKNTSKMIESQHMLVEYPKRPVFTGSQAFTWDRNESCPDHKAYIIGVSSRDPLVMAEAPLQTGGIKGEISYAWYKAELSEMNFSLTDSNPISCFTKIEGVTSNTYKPVEPGYYRALAINTLNDEKDSITSGIIRATEKAKAPKLTLTDEDGNLYSGQSVSVIVNPESIEKDRITSDCEAKECFGEDTITYQWYRYPSNSTTLEADKEIAAKGQFTDVSNMTKLEGEINADFKPQVSGLYFCVVTNNYNGDSNAVSSAIVTVISD